MPRYRKIDPRIWNDEKFRSFSDHGKFVFLFLLTHPGMTALGAMRASLPGLAAELGWTDKAFREAFREPLSKGLVRVDEKASCIMVKNFLKYNQPESPNVVKAWVSSLDLVPECPLKNEIIRIVKGFAEALPEAFRKALPEAFLKSMPNKEQKLEQELKYVSAVAEKTAPPSKNGRDPRSATQEIQLFRKVTSKYPPRPNYEEVILVMSGRTAEEVAPFYAEWTKRGYNSNSLRWLEWLKDGKIPGRNATSIPLPSTAKVCESCMNKDPVRRHQHLLSFSDESALENHLRGIFGDEAGSHRFTELRPAWKTQRDLRRREVS